ncbi:MAG: hypothetical protein COA69_01805 [Robiginitomaculum sp.]|nr:MAG: hypothetical protein COA69_01805 [Robiginitomaculum sp.]
MNIIQSSPSPFPFKRFLVSTALALLVSGGFAVLSVNNAYAQTEEEAAAGRQFSAKTGGIVLVAQEFMTAEQYSAAISELNKALALPDINPYERSVINQLLGSSYYQNNQYDQAIRAFEAAISAGGLLPNESSNLRVNIAQLLIANDQFVRGAQMLETWNRNGGQLKPAHIEMLWQAWSQAERYDRALPWAERWFNAARPKLRKHFDLLNFMYNNLNMPAKQADIVKQMINRWPEDKTLWDAWASMLANGGREQEAFEVSKMLYLGGAYSSEADLTRVVQYYSFYDMPFQAAQILEREMNAGRIAKTSDKLVQLSDLLRQSREYKRAIPILEQAAASSGKAKLYADLGEALFNEGQCVRSEDAFKKAMDRGFDQGKAWVLIANCRYDSAAREARINCDMSDAQKKSAPWTAKRVTAVQAFDNVPASSREAGNARKWKTFIRAETKAVENRCIFEANVRKEQCYIAIRQAYANMVFAGEFILDEDSCLAYKPEYDNTYRRRVEEDE